MKSRKIPVVLLCALMLVPREVRAGVLDYEAAVEEEQNVNKVVREFVVDDGAGGQARAVAREDILYVAAKAGVIRTVPGEKGESLKKVLLGTEVTRTAVCDNGWSRVSFVKKDNTQIEGFIESSLLSDVTTLEPVRDKVTAGQDCDVLDFPGRKDGEVIGEILEEEVLVRTATVDKIWSRISFEDMNGEKKTGYIPTSALKGQEAALQTEEGDAEEAGTLHKSTGEGVFADAVDDVTSVNGSGKAAKGVMVGTPVSAPGDASLKPLGTFRITHYCQCSICCGPWADGITSTGVTAVTNRTIAVDPDQIPYGSKVVINGQVYIAEDCGGAIKENCIDIYVGSHAEGESRGVYYTEVYLLQ